MAACDAHQANVASLQSQSWITERLQMHVGNHIVAPREGSRTSEIIF